jgi:hypothetical protein
MKNLFKYLNWYIFKNPYIKINNVIYEVYCNSLSNYDFYNYIIYKGCKLRIYINGNIQNIPEYKWEPFIGQIVFSCIEHLENCIDHLENSIKKNIKDIKEATILANEHSETNFYDKTDLLKIN